MIEQNNNLTLFTFNNNDIRLVVIDNQPWFVAKDIAGILDYSETSVMLRRLDDMDTRKIAPTLIAGTNEMSRELTVISEFGLYEAILGSKKTEAKEFKKWITHKILPTIRKTVRNLESLEFYGNIDGLVWSKNGSPMTTSKVVSDFTGKRHDNVLRDIRLELEQLMILSSNLRDETIKPIIEDFREVKYVAENGQVYLNYELGELATMQLLLKYSTEHRAKFIIAFYKMKEALINLFKARVIEDVLPQDSRLRQFVYVIRNPLTDLVKIGVSQDVNKRLKQLETGAGVELELVYQSIVCSNAFDVESQVHEFFSKYRVFGEWFKVTVNEVVEYLESCKFSLKSDYMKYLSLAGI